MLCGSRSERWTTSQHLTRAAASHWCTTQNAGLKHPARATVEDEDLAMLPFRERWLCTVEARLLQSLDVRGPLRHDGGSRTEDRLLSHQQSVRRFWRCSFPGSSTDVKEQSRQASHIFFGKTCCRFPVCLVVFSSGVGYDGLEHGDTVVLLRAMHGVCCCVFRGASSVRRYGCVPCPSSGRSMSFGCLSRRARHTDLVFVCAPLSLCRVLSGYTRFGEFDDLLVVPWRHFCPVHWMILIDCIYFVHRLEIVDDLPGTTPTTVEGYQIRLATTLGRSATQRPS